MDFFIPLLQEFSEGDASRQSALKGFCFPNSLHKCSQKILQIGDTFNKADGYLNDSSFLLFREMQLCLQVWGISAINMTIPAQVTKELESAKVPVATAQDCLFHIQTMLADLIDSKLEATERKPRVLQVAKELRMSPRETDALVYVLVAHCGGYLFGSINHALIPSTMARVVGLTPRELLEFLMETRAHVKQGLITTHQQHMKLSMAESRISMQLEVVAALAGADLSETQLIKLEKTALATVVEREGAIKKRKRDDGEGGSGSDVDEVGSDFSDDESDDSELDETLNPKELVEKLLKKQAKHQASQPASPTINGDKKEGLPLRRKRSEISPLSDAGGTAADQASELKASAAKMHQPYTTDIEYVEDQCRNLATMIKMRNTEGDIKDEENDYYQTKSKSEATMRELQGKERIMKATLTSRLEATKKQRNGWQPRVEIVAAKLKLTDFEKRVLLLLVGNVISHDILIAINGRYVMRDGQREMTVGYILFVLCSNLQTRVAARKYFYNSAPLLKHGLISVSLVQGRHTFNSDLMDYMVDIDRKIVDYLMGEDTEQSEMVPGSKLYAPDVPIDRVVLPESTKEQIMSTITHYDLFEQCKQKCGFSQGLGSQSTGLVFLFYGPSGTGKTMLANAIAHTLKRRLLLVSLVNFKSDGKAGDVLRFVFREAKLNDAIIFFDECESFFENRESNPLVVSILSEFEQYDGTIIMATNKAQVIDEAMNRRISLMIEFKMPDHSMREQIWRTHIPSKLTLHEDVNLEQLAMDFELSGGLIRNAALTALSQAVAREKKDMPTIRMADLVHGARQQLRGLFQAEKAPFGSESYITPRRRIDDMVLDTKLRNGLNEIIKVAKSRNTLFSQWGFDERELKHASICLFSGPPGTGKSSAAEAVANECGVPIRLSNVSELLLARELNVQQTFEEAKKLNAIIVLDAAQRLFDRSERSEQIAQLIQYHAMNYPRPVIIIATSEPNGSAVDPRAAKLDMKHYIQFQLPDRKLRAKLWNKFIPAEVPRDESLTVEEVEKLADKTCSAKFIEAVCFGACCKVALRHDPAKRKLTFADLEKERDEHVEREQRLLPHSHMFA